MQSNKHHNHPLVNAFSSLPLVSSHGFILHEKKHFIPSSIREHSYLTSSVIGPFQCDPWLVKHPSDNLLERMRVCTSVCMCEQFYFSLWFPLHVWVCACTSGCTRANDQPHNDSPNKCEGLHFYTLSRRCIEK